MLCQSIDTTCSAWFVSINRFNDRGPTCVGGRRAWPWGSLVLGKAPDHSKHRTPIYTQTEFEFLTTITFQDSKTRHQA